MTLVPPFGMAEVEALYGVPHGFIRDDGTPSPLWERRMVVCPFPSPVPLGWKLEKQASGARVHVLVAPELEHVFAILSTEGLWDRIQTFDGGYAWRPQRGSTGTLSMHAFGAAVDFNAATNEQGTPGHMSLAVVQIFEGCGWTWGGRFGGSRIDAMHFQFARGV